MSYLFTISTNNYSGYSANVTFNPSTGGTIDLGSVILPYKYFTEYYYGVYEIYIPETGVTCILDYPLPSPTPTVTPTNTVTPTVTPTPTITPTITPTNTVIDVYFEDCCDVSVKLKLTTTNTEFTIGQTYYVGLINSMTNYKGCLKVITPTTVSAEFNKFDSFITYENCSSCISREFKGGCPTPTPTPTPTLTHGLSPTNTITPTVTPTNTPTITSTQTPTNTPTNTPTSTLTPTTPCLNCVQDTVTIGTQTWDKCNLNVTTYANGDIIPQVTDPTVWSALTTGAWCYYNNDPSNEVVYGKLYNWFAVNDPRGLAPNGSHIPTNEEWTTLTTFLGGETVAGGKLKETGFCHWLSPNTDATNESGFTALPGGYRLPLGDFLDVNINGIWWSSSDILPADYGWYRIISNSFGGAFSGNGGKQAGVSVRCLIDVPVTPTPTPTNTPTNTITPTVTPTVTPTLTISSQTITYLASTEIIPNPERGLQKYSKNVNNLGNYVLVNQSTLISNRTGVDKITILYRYIMLDAYMNTDIIDNTYLNNVQTDFNRVRNAGIKIILRISYNNDTLVDTQPLKSRIIAHIEALSTVFNSNKDVILSIQAGSIGKYGEWYYTDGSSEFGDEDSILPSQWLNRKDVVDAMLTNFEDVPIQVRYANAKIQMYGSTLITSGTSYQNTPLARVGFYNDALLNDFGDQGTYSIGSQCTNPTGVTEYNFISNAGQYLPMTGEPNGINPCDGGYRTSGFNAVYEFNLLNFSVINRDYEPNVWDGWINQGYYDEILKNLGYRLELISTTLSGSNLSLTINNVGYSKILFEKKTYIIYRDNLNTEYKRLTPLDIRTLEKGVNVVNITLPNDVPSNSYSILLQISDKNIGLENTVEYCIQFANTGIWELSTGYNNLLQTVIVP